MQIVITGSSSGIGRATAERLLRRGHHVWGIARTDQAEFARIHAPHFTSSVCDVGQPDAITAVVAEVQHRWSRVDALITCAGTQGAIGRTSTIDPQAWAQTVHTNLTGTFLTLRMFWPLLLRAERRAKVVCFSGGGATKARPNFSAYGVAKTAIVRLVETIAEEESDTLIDLNAIAPGAVPTAMTDEVLRLGASMVGDTEYATAQATRSQGDAPIARVLDLVEWLLSEGSDGISGKLISAQWDPWPKFAAMKAALKGDLCTVRRITPETRGQLWPQD